MKHLGSPAFARGVQGSPFSIQEGTYSGFSLTPFKSCLDNLLANWLSVMKGQCMFIFTICDRNLEPTEARERLRFGLLLFECSYCWSATETEPH